MFVVVSLLQRRSITAGKRHMPSSRSVKATFHANRVGRWCGVAMTRSSELGGFATASLGCLGVHFFLLAKAGTIFLQGLGSHEATRYR